MPLKVLFFGTADFAVPCLEALIAHSHEIIGVVTQPDKPTGRGMQLSASPVKKAAEHLNLPVLQPRRVRAESFVARVQEMAPESIVVAAFGQIIPQSILDVPRFGPINVHGSLLPEYRGAAPIQRAILDGKSVTGVTTMFMDATLDTGDMLLKETIDILPEDNSGTLFSKLATVGAKLLIQTLNGLEAGNIERVKQDSALATYAAMIKPEDCLLSWQHTAFQIRCRVQALLPKPGAYTFYAGKRIKIHACSVVEMEGTEAMKPGTVVKVQKTPPGLAVAAGSNTVLLLKEVQPENGKRMTADAWANGLRVKPGDSFSEA
jgi:methionyl-tRNA formyltransferase